MSIQTVMVIGAGQMGGGIAQVMAQAGRKTYLNDVNMDIVKARMAFIEKLLVKDVSKGKITEEQKAAALANQKIAAGAGFEEVCDAVIAYAEAGHILFSLASFENLAKNGRVSKVVGFIAGALNMRVLGRRTPDGKIDFFFKTRGESRVLARILEQMDRDGFDGSRSVMVSHCHNEKAAQLLCHGIQAKWPDTTVEIVPCSGLCSFYAQDQGLIVTY